MTDMKQRIRTACHVAVCLLFAACEQEKPTEFPEIRIGKTEALKEISLNKLTGRSIILSGGNGKYKVNVENSRIAQASIASDTLKVKGLSEGETYATIQSHDQKATLKIQVTYPTLRFSQDSVRIHPQERSFYVSLTGGGEQVKLIEDDPEEVINVKWDGNSELLEIVGLYEGEARLTAVAQDGNKQTLKVSVKVEDELTVPGIYGTDKRYFSNNQLAGNTMIAEREGVGTWFVNSARPYGGSISQGQYQGTSIKVTNSSVSPTVGEYVDIEIAYQAGTPRGIAPGRYKMLIEEIRDSAVLLRKREFKILLPYHK